MKGNDRPTCLGAFKIRLVLLIFGSLPPCHNAGDPVLNDVFSEICVGGRGVVEGIGGVCV